jgi:hypothetical protein
MKRRIKSFDTCRVRFEIATLSPENLRRTGFEKRVVDDITVQVQKGETVSPYIQISYKASLIPAIDSTFDAARSTPRFSHLPITRHTSFRDISPR